jgi:hypothetical protein
MPSIDRNAVPSDKHQNNLFMCGTFDAGMPGPSDWFVVCSGLRYYPRRYIEEKSKAIEPPS